MVDVMISVFAAAGRGRAVPACPRDTFGPACGLLHEGVTYIAELFEALDGFGSTSRFKYARTPAKAGGQGAFWWLVRAQ